MPCRKTQHRNNVPILHQAWFETAQQAATLAKLDSLCHLFNVIFSLVAFQSHPFCVFLILIELTWAKSFKKSPKLALIRKKILGRALQTLHTPSFLEFWIRLTTGLGAITYQFSQ